MKTLKEFLAEAIEVVSNPKFMGKKRPEVTGTPKREPKYDPPHYQSKGNKNPELGHTTHEDGKWHQNEPKNPKPPGGHTTHDLPFHGKSKLAKVSDRPRFSPQIGQFHKVGKIASVPGKKDPVPEKPMSTKAAIAHSDGGCPHCGEKTYLKLDHDRVRGHEGHTRKCYACSHSWTTKAELEKKANSVKEGIEQPFDPKKLKNEGGILSRFFGKTTPQKPQRPLSGTMDHGNSDIEPSSVPEFKSSVPTMRRNQLLNLPPKKND